MRKLFSLIIAATALTVITLQSCSKGGSGGGTPAAGGLTVSVNKSSIRADNFDELVITVKDLNGTDVTSGSTIKINGTPSASNKFYSSTPGNITIKATKSGASSPDVTVTATDPGPSPFTQKLLTEDYTGTWCGYCPRVGTSLKTYSSSNPNCIVVGIHGPSGSSDPYNYLYISQLASAFGISSFPTVIVNRDAKWLETSTELNTQLSKRAPVGVGLETTVSGSTITIKAKVKFDITTEMPLKLVVMLVEDNLVASQVNYYAPTYGPDPIAGYIHKNTLRSAGTDIFGDDIPVAQQVSGTTWEKDLTINAAGYNISNCKIIATVVYGTNGLRRGSLNTQIVTAGQTKNFD
ncbi:MAG: Omp28-related outer membrane protein [Bacteroidetes bacterium]|nr:MAG: Omp28-related outer membrane protein [Bacteroidota bacterium]